MQSVESPTGRSRVKGRGLAVDGSIKGWRQQCRAGGRLAQQHKLALIPNSERQAMILLRRCEDSFQS